jgi:hypothetical protein
MRRKEELKNRRNGHSRERRNGASKWYYYYGRRNHDGGGKREQEEKGLGRKKKKKRTKVIGLKSDEAFSGLIDKGQTARLQLLTYIVVCRCPVIITYYVIIPVQYDRYILLYYHTSTYYSKKTLIRGRDSGGMND